MSKLLSLAEPFGKRTWAIESADGLGYLLAQQLVDAGEFVLDVPLTLVAPQGYLVDLMKHPGISDWPIS